MARNKLSDLHNHLFETLEMLKDPDTPLDLARAKTICEVAQVLINSAKVEVELLKVIDGKAASEFFSAPAELPAPRLLNR